MAPARSAQAEEEGPQSEAKSQVPLDQFLNLGKKDANSSSPDRASSQATQLSEIKIDPNNSLARKSIGVN